MSSSSFRVVLDANVLYPSTVRDTLLRSAAEGWFQVCWSRPILDETAGNLVKNGLMTQERAERLVGRMMSAFPEALVTGFEALIPAMQNDVKDRHVAAAAVRAGAQVIVTNNLKDFRNLPEGIEAQSADEFLLDLWDLHPDSVVQLLRVQAGDLQNPPRTYDDLLRGLEKTVPRFVAAVRGSR